MSAGLRGLPGQVPVAWVTHELPNPGWDGGVFDSGVTEIWWTSVLWQEG